jgi:hypothetical protein
MEYLRIQANYMMQHLRLADAKAAVVVGYCGATLGFTIKLLDPVGPAAIAVIGIAAIMLNFVAAATCVWAVLPRLSKTGAGCADEFSWLCLPDREGHYADRILKLSREELVRSIADTMDALASLLHRKYRLIQASIWVAGVAAPMHLLVWAV